MLGYFYWAVKFIWMAGPLSRNEKFRLKLGQLVDIKARNLLITMVIYSIIIQSRKWKMCEGCTVKRHRDDRSFSAHLQDQGDPAPGTLIRGSGEPDGPVCGVRCTSSRDCSPDWLHTRSDLAPRHLTAAIVTLLAPSLGSPLVELPLKLG